MQEWFAPSVLVAIAVQAIGVGVWVGAMRTEVRRLRDDVNGLTQTLRNGLNARVMEMAKDVALLGQSVRDHVEASKGRSG